MNFETASMRAACAGSMTELAEKHPDLVALGADGRGLFTDLAAKFPDRYVDVGIAEANLVGVASGLARCGLRVVVGAMSCFLSRRAYEQLRLDVALPGLSVTLVGVGGGLGYGTLGPSHHAPEDVALFAMLPGVRVYSPADATEARRILELEVSTPGTSYLRLGAREDPVVSVPAPVGDPRRPAVLRQGGSALILATGRCVAEGLLAWEALHADGVEVTVASVPCLRPFPTADVAELCRPFRHVVTVEEAVEAGGLGYQAVATGASGPATLTRLCVGDGPAPVAGREALLAHYGIDAAAIRRAVVSLVGGAST